MKNIITIVIALTLGLNSYSQKFVSSGKIEFERKVNLHKLYDYEGTWGEYIRKTAPQFITSYFDLVFREDKSIYKPGREVLTQKPTTGRISLVQRIPYTTTIATKVLPARSRYLSSYFLSRIQCQR